MSLVALVPVAKRLKLLNGCDTLLVDVDHGTDSQIFIRKRRGYAAKWAAAVMQAELPTAAAIAPWFRTCHTTAVDAIDRRAAEHHSGHARCGRQVARTTRLVGIL